MRRSPLRTGAALGLVLVAALVGARAVAQTPYPGPPTPGPVPTPTPSPSPYPAPVEAGPFLLDASSFLDAGGR